MRIGSTNHLPTAVETEGRSKSLTEGTDHLCAVVGRLQSRRE